MLVERRPSRARSLRRHVRTMWARSTRGEANESHSLNPTGLAVTFHCTAGHTGLLLGFGRGKRHLVAREHGPRHDVHHPVTRDLRPARVAALPRPAPHIAATAPRPRPRRGAWLPRVVACKDDHTPGRVERAGLGAGGGHHGQRVEPHRDLGPLRVNVFAEPLGHRPERGSDPPDEPVAEDGVVLVALEALAGLGDRRRWVALIGLVGSRSGGAARPHRQTDTFARIRDKRVRTSVRREVVVKSPPLLPLLPLLPLFLRTLLLTHPDPNTHARSSHPAPRTWSFSFTHDPSGRRRIQPW